MGTIRFRLLFSILSIALLVACSKSDSNLSHRLISSGNTTSIIYGLSIYNQEIKSAGGEVWLSGAVGSIDSLEKYTSTQIHTQSMFAVACDEELCLTVGNFGKAFISTDFRQWSNLPTASEKLLKGALVTTDYMFAVGGHGYGNGVIHRWNKDGSNQQSFDMVEELRDIEIAADGRLVAVGFGVIYVSDDTGLSWQVQDIENDFYRAITKDNEGHLYSIGWGGTILKSMDNARSWQTLSGPGLFAENKRWTDATITLSEELVIIGVEGLVEIYDLEGSLIESFQIDESVDLHSVLEFQGRIIVAGTEESIYELH